MTSPPPAESVIARTSDYLRAPATETDVTVAARPPPEIFQKATYQEEKRCRAKRGRKFYVPSSDRGGREETGREGMMERRRGKRSRGGRREREGGGRERSSEKVVDSVGHERE